VALLHCTWGHSPDLPKCQVNAHSDPRCKPSCRSVLLILQQRLIKDVVAGLVRPLAYIYNLSIETGIFPENLKIAKVIPAYKKGDACMASNYRPISLFKCI